MSISLNANHWEDLVWYPLLLLCMKTICTTLDLAATSLSIVYELSTQRSTFVYNSLCHTTGKFVKPATSLMTFSI